MIRKLRRKFIATNMLLVGLVLVIVFSVLVGSNYRQWSEQSLGAMRMALTWSENSPPPMVEIGPAGDEGFKGGDHADRDGARRQFNMIAVFSVTLDGDGAVASAHKGNNVDVSDEVLAQAAQAALEDGGDSGVLSKLDLRFLRETGEDGTVRVAFADRTWENESLGRLVLTSLVVGALALLAFFCVSLFLSKQALKPVQEAWDQQRQFVADASHELKTPITVILANAGIVLAHPEDPVGRQAKWIAYIQEEAGRMRSLVDDLLFLAKSDAARQPAAMTPVRLSELVTGALLPFESVAFEAGVALQEQVEPGLTLQGNEIQLRRLVGILLDNAIKYAGSPGTVTVRLEGRGERLCLSVHNTGAPIAPEHLPHLFERFYRADEARDRERGGYGLGLAIAKTVAEAHRGKIAVSSSAGNGTVFSVLFPR